MTQKSEKIKAFEKLSFEDAMTELEKLVTAMEDGSMKLENMIQNFEEAQILAKLCQGKLNMLKRKVEVLTRDSSAGQEWRQMDTRGIVDSQNDFFPVDVERPEDSSETD